MKQKIIFVLIFLALAALAILFWQNATRVPKGWKAFDDQTNKVSFIYPENWNASSQPRYISLISRADSSKSILLTINPSQYFLDLAGLTEQASRIRVGKKDFLISQKEEKIRDPQDTTRFLDKTLTFTHLLWIDDAGTKYWFQIRPGQEKLDQETFRILDSFRPWQNDQ